MATSATIPASHTPAATRERLRMIVPRVVGVLLLIAAGLKLYGLAVQPIASVGVFSAPEVQVALVNGEVLLRLWLLSGYQPVTAWLTALTAFGCFTGASYYMGWIGQTSCGCLGAVQFSP